ncbi:MAG: mannitol dehydrogenase family protein [Succiniclasticum sp.]|nr:mannitol dehydrogenase family protein [Succiniclasticum sp.]
MGCDLSGKRAINQTKKIELTSEIDNSLKCIRLEWERRTGMRLSLNGLENQEFWHSRQFALPEFSIKEMREKTERHPAWVHIGPGNIFRSFIAHLQQKLLNQGLVDVGITAVEARDSELIDIVYKAHDNLSILVTMNPDQSCEKTVIGSIGEVLTAIPGSEDWQRLKRIFSSPDLQIVSFTVTEKGYKLKSGDGIFMPEAEKDFSACPDNSLLFPCKLASLLYVRFLGGQYPITLLSLDNCSHNGAVVEEAINEVALQWSERGLVKKEFLTYIKEKISYPWSMIDKITPRPAENVQSLLIENDIEDIGVISNHGGSFFAPFVNAEKTEYLVVEDSFKNGRPPLEKVGVIFTDRETVDKVERMKVCTCLNPLHTTLAVYGCLLGYTLIADEMRDKELKRLVWSVGREGLPVVTDPGVLSPEKFMKECLEIRFPNPAIPDTPQRIACDTSQKVGIRFGVTIREYGMKAGELRYIPLAIAGWCRYLMGVDDEGKSFELSPDPLLLSLTERFKNIRLGETVDSREVLKPILSDVSIFGSNLYDTGVAGKIENYFEEMIQGAGAIRDVLKKYLSSECQNIQ